MKNTRTNRFLLSAGQCLALALLAGCAEPSGRKGLAALSTEAELTIASGATNRVVTLAELSRNVRPATVTVNDYVYSKVKRYEGFWLEDVLGYAGVRFEADSVLVFSALDGYQARLARLPGPPLKPLLAVRDIDRPEQWEVLTHGKERVTPGPFYLVWSGDAKGLSNAAPLPWPYQIARIELRKADESQRKLLPQAAESHPEVTRGFGVFMKNCIACHSINLEGGTQGPELNIPRNITEYREANYLVEFIKDPSSFRARSKMPTFRESLSADDIESVLNYLSWMRDHKQAMKN